MDATVALVSRTVDSVPISILNDVFAPDLQRLTQRPATSDAAAFHSHSTLAANHESDTRGSTTTPPVGQRNVVTAGVATVASNAKSPWRLLDESIDHMYADASTDTVQLKLLHAHKGDESRRLKHMAHERVVAAASALRAQASQAQERHARVQRAKQQAEQLSEAIRRQNKRLATHRSQSVAAVEEERRYGVAAASESDNAERQRKPPVPRQRGRRTPQSTHSRSSRLRDATDAIVAQIDSLQSERRRTETRLEAVPVLPTQDQSAAAAARASVASSILLGASSEFAVRSSHQSNGEESHEVGAGSPARSLTGSQELLGAEAPTALPPDTALDVVPANNAGSSQQQQPQQQPQQHSVRRQPERQRPHRHHVSKQPTPRRLDADTVTGNEPVGGATGTNAIEQTERRALAREYMEMQKQTRMLARAREKQQREDEKQLRAAKLEVRASA